MVKRKAAKPEKPSSKGDDRRDDRPTCTYEPCGNKGHAHEDCHKLGYVHRDLKPGNVLLRSLELVEVVISDHCFAQESFRAMTWCVSGVWSAPECLWTNDASAYGFSVDMCSLRVTLIWLISNFDAEDGEYINESRMSFSETIQ